MVDRRRNGVVAEWVAFLSAILVAVIYVVAYQLPYWQFTLHAPQYPEGLDLVIYLDHLGGRVREIDGLNHYIGMEKLGRAAQLERQYSEWGIVLLAVLVGGSLLVFRRGWWKWVALVPAVAFPVVFIVDMYYWLYRFGHNLSPRAPIDFPSFTPTMFGEGKIGQFTSNAYPGAGFWMSVAAVGVIVASILLQSWLRRPVDGASAEEAT